MLMSCQAVIGWFVRLLDSWIVKEKLKELHVLHVKNFGGGRGFEHLTIHLNLENLRSSVFRHRSFKLFCNLN